MSGPAQFRCSTWKLTLAAIAILMATQSLAAQNAASVLRAAAKSMGVDRMKTIEYSGSGSQFVLGQNWTPAEAWPRFNLKSYRNTIDYDTPASREEMVRTQALRPPHGGGPQPIYGDVLQLQFLSGALSWNAAGDAAIPQPAAAGDRTLQIWLTPHGFIKAAQKNKATLKYQTVAGKKMRVISFVGGAGSKITGYINERGLVEKVDTWMDNPELGDMPVESRYTDYKDFGGVKFPARIVQDQGGHPVLDVNVQDVKANLMVNISAPDAVKQVTKAAELPVDPQRLGRGLYYFGGESHTALAIEFKDFLVVIEAPLNEERSLAIMRETRRLLPNKPIKYLVSTHHHFDHSGGVRAYAAEGATILTYQGNKKFYEEFLKAPHIIRPDKLYTAKAAARIETVEEKKVISDGERNLELYHLTDNPHNEYMLMAYLPAEKILIEADMYSPPPAGAPKPPYPLDLTFPLSLYDNLKRLRLDVKQIAALHNRVVSMDEYLASIGKPLY